MKLNVIIIGTSFLIFFLNCCSTKKGGAIPVYIDEYVTTTKGKTFELQIELMGKVVAYQKSYNCLGDSIIQNATTIVKTKDNDTLTIYTPCFKMNLQKGDLIKLNKLQDQFSSNRLLREIYIPFPKSSRNYGYWECISCKYPNTMALIEIMN